MASYQLPTEQVLRIAGISEGDERDNLYYDTLAKMAQHIYEYRIANKISNKDLATRAGIATSAMSRIESGNRNISLKTLCKVLSIIGSDIEFKKSQK